MAELSAYLNPLSILRSQAAKLAPHSPASHELSPLEIARNEYARRQDQKRQLNPLPTPTL